MREPSEHAPPRAPHITLRADDYFVCRWSPFLRRHVWAVKHHKPVAWLGTALNLYVLVTAIKMIESFQPLHVDDYAISDLGGDQCTAAAAAASPPAPAASGLTGLLKAVGVSTEKVGSLQLDMATQLARCYSSLEVRGELLELKAARILYWYIFYTACVAFLVVDVTRLCGLSTSLGDVFLGFRSPRAEGRRFRPMLLATIPLVHLGFFYTRPVHLPCCVATPKLLMALDRIRTLTFLLFVSCFCLLGDAHNHGYFILRIPDAKRSATMVVRSVLAEPPPRLGDEQDAQETELLSEGGSRGV